MFFFFLGGGGFPRVFCVSCSYALFFGVAPRVFCVLHWMIKGLGLRV